MNEWSCTRNKHLTFEPNSELVQYRRGCIFHGDHLTVKRIQTMLPLGQPRQTFAL
jgi:hypothetical protein